MKVILKESYANLGEAGDIVNVKPGYARNFLIPERLALTATAANLKFFKDKTKEIEAKKQTERSKAEKVRDVLAKISLHMKVKASDEGKLFGSITGREIADELIKKGAEVDKRQVILARPIKMVGEYSALVKLVGNLSVTVPIKIESDTQSQRQMDDEAEEEQAKRVKKDASKKIKEELN